jgi:hypothetical protein
MKTMIGKAKLVQISRRSLLEGAACVGGAALLHAAAAIRPAEAQAGKISQKVVKYQDTPIGEDMCSGCELFVPPHSCRIVDGTISPSGWCVRRALQGNICPDG